MRGIGSVESVLEMVRDGIDAELDKIRRDAEDESRRLREEAARERIEVPGREERLSAERRRAAELLAREDWEDRRRALQRLEEFVARAAERGSEALAARRDPAENRSVLARLVAEAVERLPGDEFDVAFAGEGGGFGLTPDDVVRALGNRAAAQAPRFRFSSEPVTGTGGCVVSTADGRLAYDNRFEARLQRLESAWRCAAAEIFGP